jgi:hypothetical protein
MGNKQETGRTFTPVTPNGCDATYWLCNPDCRGQFVSRETTAFRGE